MPTLYINAIKNITLQDPYPTEGLLVIKVDADNESNTYVTKGQLQARQLCIRQISLSILPAFLVFLAINHYQHILRVNKNGLPKIHHRLPKEYTLLLRVLIRLYQFLKYKMFSYIPSPRLKRGAR